MSKIANDHLHYVLHLEKVIEELFGILFYILQDGTSGVNNPGLLLLTRSCLNYLPSEFETTNQMREFISFLEEKIKDERKDS